MGEPYFYPEDKTSSCCGAYAFLEISPDGWSLCKACSEWAEFKTDEEWEIEERNKNVEYPEEKKSENTDS